MTKKTKTPQLAAFLRWLDTDGARLVSAALVAKAFAQCERDRVNAYELPFFATWGFRADKQRSNPTEILTNPRDLYLSDEDDRAAEYYKAMDALHRKHGFTGPEGHCPALTAEWAQTQAENAVLDSISAFLGIKSPSILEYRAQLLDIACRAAVQRMSEAA